LIQSTKSCYFLHKVINKTC